MDTLTAEQRRACMQAVGDKDTAPEMRVRRLIHAMGFRYSLHAKSLPGKPDLVFVSRRKIVFVHGCFWHNHNCRHGRISPAKNSEYWSDKRERNAERDRENIKALRKDGWKVLVVWECLTRDTESLGNIVKSFLREIAPLRKMSQRPMSPAKLPQTPIKSGKKRQETRKIVWRKMAGGL